MEIHSFLVPQTIPHPMWNKEYGLDHLGHRVKQNVRKKNSELRAVFLLTKTAMIC